MWGRREELDARVACVSFAPPRLLEAYRRELGVDAELYADETRAAYAAFGFGRASKARTWLDPRVHLRYLALMARGRRFHRPREDAQQLGGDVVADAEGRVTWVYASRGPEDRPPVDEVVARARAAAAPR